MIKRFNLRIDEEAYHQLILLKEKTESRNLAEIFRKALSAYDALNDAVIAGGKVFVRHADGKEQEVIL